MGPSHLPSATEFVGILELTPFALIVSFQDSGTVRTRLLLDAQRKSEGRRAFAASLSTDGLDSWAIR